MICNLSQFKKALVLGSKWHMVYHLDFDHRNPDGSIVFRDKDNGVRDVSIVQTNAVAFRRPDGKDSWLHFGKASEWRFENEKAIHLTPRDNSANSPLIDTLTYTPV